MPNVTTKEKPINLDQCHRCGGMMASELIRETNSVERRCIICGERVDSVILFHRRQRSASTEVEQLFAQAGSGTLN